MASVKHLANQLAKLLAQLLTKNARNRNFVQGYSTLGSGLKLVDLSTAKGTVNVPLFYLIEGMIIYDTQI